MSGWGAVRAAFSTLRASRHWNLESSLIFMFSSVLKTRTLGPTFNIQLASRFFTGSLSSYAPLRICFSIPSVAQFPFV